MPKRAMDTLTESMFYCLMALSQEPRCGIEIVEFIDRHTHGRIKTGPATLYTILGKFEKEKYIQEIRVEGRKRTYRITSLGTQAYREELERLKQCVLDAESAQGGA